jgi:hypothetical protein
VPLSSGVSARSEDADALVVCFVMVRWRAAWTPSPLSRADLAPSLHQPNPTLMLEFVAAMAETAQDAGSVVLIRTRQLKLSPEQAKALFKDSDSLVAVRLTSLPIWFEPRYSQLTHTPRLDARHVESSASERDDSRIGCHGVSGPSMHQPSRRDPRGRQLCRPRACLLIPGLVNRAVHTPHLQAAVTTDLSRFSPFSLSCFFGQTHGGPRLPAVAPHHLVTGLDSEPVRVEGMVC